MIQAAFLSDEVTYFASSTGRYVRTTPRNTATLSEELPAVQPTCLKKKKWFLLVATFLWMVLKLFIVEYIHVHRYETHPTAMLMVPGGVESSSNTASTPTTSTSQVLDQRSQRDRQPVDLSLSPKTTATKKA
jgi:hypothetical protein